jgi:parallel beta-helix repeat protein
MSRLPVPGSDQGQWGQILNDFLSVEHNTDGTFKTAVIPLSQKGATNGVASLGSGGKLTDSQVPDDVLRAVDLPYLVASDYGVDTNLSDTGPAINAYLTACATAGKMAYLPAGVYVFSTAIAIPANIHLYGDGPATVLKLAAGFAASHPIYNKVSVGFDNVIIRDLAVDGNAVQQSGDQTLNGTPNEAIGLIPSSGTNVVVERVHQYDSYRLGIVLSNISGGAIRDCLVENNGRDGISLFNACSNIVIRGNRVSGCNDDHIALDGEVAAMSNIVVADNVIIGPGARGLGKGIRVQGCNGATVTGNVIDGLLENGIIVNDWGAHPVRNVEIVGNSIKGIGLSGSGSKAGILLHCGNAVYPSGRSSWAGIYDVIISSNTITNCGGNGIELRTDHADDELVRVKVDNNSISSCLGFGVITTTGSSVNSGDLSVTNNVVYGNAGHGIFAQLSKRLKVCANTSYNNGSAGINTIGIRIVTVDILICTDNSTYETRVGGSRTQTVGIQIVGTGAVQLLVKSNLAYGMVTGWSYQSFPGAAIQEGFFSTASTTRQSAGTTASDPATTQALANQLRASLVNLGLIS